MFVICHILFVLDSAVNVTGKQFEEQDIYLCYISNLLVVYITFCFVDFSLSFYIITNHHNSFIFILMFAKNFLLRYN